VSPLTTVKCCLDEELSPTQAEEDTPECQAIVKRYKNNKVGRGDFNAGTEVSPLTTTKCCLDEELAPTQAGETHQSSRPSLKGTRIIRGGGDFNAGRKVSPLTEISYWEKELAPTQAGEETPECQTIVKR
jgi:hypothetical protein